jgi:small subunit ribosomal protein S17
MASIKKTTEKQDTGRTLQGAVVKTAMKDSATVLVERYILHPKYKKYYTVSKKFIVHDPGNSLGVGDKVVIKEVRPISKRKRHIIVSRVAAPVIEA